MGPDVLYKGSIGEMVAAMTWRRMAVFITRGGLCENYRIHLREPVRGTYRGYDIVSVAPTSSGGTAIIEILNILEGFDVASLGFGTAEGARTCCRKR